MTLTISEAPLSLKSVQAFAFDDQPGPINLDPQLEKKVSQSEKHLHNLLEKKIPVYGVTTGFGDNSSRLVSREQSTLLQDNLVSYLSCGTGPKLPKEVCKATFLLRLKSLSRGYSGVSFELLEKMKLFLERDWIPVIPREGSLGASGDLIPLAYIALALRGEGSLYVGDQVRSCQEVLKEAEIKPYSLKPKEGLAIVNGTTAMAAYGIYNLERSKRLLENAIVGGSWLCLILEGRQDSFGELVNKKAKSNPGQSQVAQQISSLLKDEGYLSNPLKPTDSTIASEPIQDQYSLRCIPQILGPVLDTLSLVEGWLEAEVNGVSDNPLFDEDGSMASGGNFYGGYLSQGMDYLKISLAHVADLMDRQLMLLFNDKTSRGLPANLVNTKALSEKDRFAHHGLKGLHQSVSAITSEILPKAVPNGIFSRSSESHNQDKVSLGMSAASQCSDMIDTLFTVQAMYFACFSQALDLRGIQLQSQQSRQLYDLVRAQFPMISSDQPLGDNIEKLASSLKLKGVFR